MFQAKAAPLDKEEQMVRWCCHVNADEALRMRMWLFRVSEVAMCFNAFPTLVYTGSLQPKGLNGPDGNVRVLYDGDAPDGASSHIHLRMLLNSAMMAWMAGDISSVSTKLRLAISTLPCTSDPAACSSLAKQVIVMSRQLATGLDFYGHPSQW
jgi:hypothetical protein